MKSARPFFSAMLLIFATTLWGISSAILAKLGKANGTGAPLLAAGGAIALTIVVLAGPTRNQVKRIALVQRYPISLVKIGLLEALNLGLYATALALGPVPVVVALHLTSPVLLLVLFIILGQRRLDIVAIAQILLIVGGLALLGMSPTQQSGSKPLLAGVLAVGSAVVVAALIAAVVNLAHTVNPDIASAVQLTIAAVATAPIVLVASPPDQVDAAILFGAGALFLGPGFAIYWRALRGLTAATAGILGLNEVLSATILSGTLLNTTVSLTSAVSGILVLAAVALEFRRAKNGRHASIVRSSNKLE